MTSELEISLPQPWQHLVAPVENMNEKFPVGTPMIALCGAVRPRIGKTGTEAITLPYCRECVDIFMAEGVIRDELMHQMYSTLVTLATVFNNAAGTRDEIQDRLNKYGADHNYLANARPENDKKETQ